MKIVAKTYNTWLFITGIVVCGFFARTTAAKDSNPSMSDSEIQSAIEVLETEISLSSTELRDISDEYKSVPN